MFKKLIVLLFIPLFVFTPVALAQENLRSGEVSILEKVEVINKDYFSAGERVVLSGSVNGDAYLAGGNILVDGNIDGDLLVAGGNVNISGVIKGDVRAAGGSVEISGAVGGNVTAVAGNIRVGKGAEVLGSLVSGGGNVEIFGPVGKGVTIGAGSATIASTIGSDILAGVGRLDLTSTSDINGNLTYFSEEDAGISSEASISGKVTHNYPARRDGEKVESYSKGAVLGWSVYSFITSFVIGLISIFAFPNFTRKAANLIIEKPFVSLGVGFITLILTPFAILILILTIIGLPLGLLLIATYLFLIFIAKIFAAISLGELIMEKSGQKQKGILAFFLGLLIITAFSVIPIVGWAISFLSTIFGLGAFVLTKKNYYLELRSKKII